MSYRLHRFAVDLTKSLSVLAVVCWSSSWIRGTGRTGDHVGTAGLSERSCHKKSGNTQEVQEPKHQLRYLEQGFSSLKLETCGRPI